MQSTKNSFDKSKHRSTDNKVPARLTSAEDNKQENHPKKDNPEDSNANPIYKGLVTFDTTTCPQDIAYPKYLNLLNDTHEKIEELIDHLYRQDLHKDKPRTFCEVAHKTYFQTV